METEPTDPTAPVIDLAPISDACRGLVAWYDAQLSGAEPTIDALQPVMAQLQQLPEIPGRLGSDIELITSADASRTRDELVGAIERLRQVASHNASEPGQTQLPGFEQPEQIA